MIEGTVPFVMRYESQFEGESLERPRLVLKDNKVDLDQKVLPLPPDDQTTVDLIWPTDAQEATSS